MAGERKIRGHGAKSPSKNDSIRKKSVYVDPRSHCLWLGFVIAAKYQSAGDGSSPVFQVPAAEEFGTDLA